MPRNFLLLLVIVFLALTVWPQGLWAQETEDISVILEPLAIGTQAPTFKAQTHLGKDFDLDDHLGKSPIVLSFWSIYCDSCVDEILPITTQ